MTTTFFLEAFGQLTPDTAAIDTEAEDLYSVFHGQAELMGWSTLATRHPVLWNMHGDQIDRWGRLLQDRLDAGWHRGWEYESSVCPARPRTMLGRCPSTVSGS